MRHTKRHSGLLVMAFTLLTSSSYLVAQEPTGATTEAPGFFSKLLGGAASGEAVGPRQKSITVVLSTEMQLAILQTERDAYSRRLDACHRLREIAVEMGDEQLEAQVNDLERRAMETYRVRVNRIGVRTNSLSGGAVVKQERDASVEAILAEPVAAKPMPTLPTNGFKEVSR